MSGLQYFRNNFTGGVIDPRLVGRTDLVQWQNGLLAGTNVVTIPQGGLKRRPGLKYIDAAERVINRVLSATLTITATNGGTTANANDDSEATLLTTTVAIGTTNPYEVVRYQRASNTDKVTYADVVGIRLSAGSSTQFCIQSSTDGATWTTELALALVDTTPRTYRVAAAGTTRLYWRVARIGATDLTTSVCSLAEFTLWTETTAGVPNAASDSRLLSFEFNDSQEFLFVLTGRNCRVYSSGAVVANIRTPWVSADLAELDATQSADTMILVHEDYAPQIIQRGSSNAVWYIGAVAFTAVPQVDYDDTSSPTPTSHVLTLTFAGAAWDDGDRFKVVIDGSVTEDIVFAGDTNANEQATTAENIRKAVQGLPTVGLAGITVSRTGVLVHTLTFAGDSAKDYSSLFSCYPTSGNSANRITVAHTTPGVPRTEDVWSTTRGWPKTVTFHEGRLYFFGTTSQPQSLFASVVNDFFNFEIGAGRDDEAIFVTLNTDQLNAGRAIFSGRALQMFTGGAEFFVPDSPITPSLTVKQQTRYGSIARKPVTIDGATIYVQKTGKVVREFVFSFDEDAYIAPPLSILAPHLLNSVRALAAWEGDGQDDTNLVLFVNGDGTLAVLNTLRAQSINAWSKWTTDGTFKDVVAVDEVLYCTVNRTIDGVATTMVEQFDRDYYTDCALLGTTGAAGTLTVAHLTATASVDVRLSNRALYADGDDTQYALVANILDLGSDYGLDEVEVGLRFTPSFTLLSPGGPVENGESWAFKKRADRAVIYGYETLGLQINDGHVTRKFPNFILNDTPLGGDPDLVTGFSEMPLTTGWKRELTLTISQAYPLPMVVLAVDVAVQVGDR